MPKLQGVEKEIAVVFTARFATTIAKSSDNEPRGQARGAKDSLLVTTVKTLLTLLIRGIISHKKVYFKILLSKLKILNLLIYKNA